MERCPILKYVTISSHVNSVQALLLNELRGQNKLNDIIVRQIQNVGCFPRQVAWSLSQKKNIVMEKKGGLFKIK